MAVVAKKDDQATLSIYCSDAFKIEVAVEAAHAGGISRSEWCRRILAAAVDASKRRREGSKS